MSDDQNTADLKALTQVLVESGDIWAMLDEDQRKIAMRQFLRLHKER